MTLSPFLKASVALHAAAVPALAIAPQRWPWIVGALLVDHYVTIGGGLLPRSALLGPNLRRSGVAAAAGAVVLTFDDGPDPVATPAILDALDARGAKATFFCVGEHAARHRELTAEISRRGHRLENHSYTHRNGFFFHTPATLDREIERCQVELQRAAGRAPSFFRAPAGIRSPLLEGALVRHRLRLASWTRRGFDTASTSPASIASRLTRGLSAGDVLLLHDGAFRDRPGRERRARGPPSRPRRDRCGALADRAADGRSPRASLTARGGLSTVGGHHRLGEAPLMTRQVLAGVIAAILIAGVVQAGVPPPVADLSITKTDDMPTYTAGGLVTYTVVVGNSGPAEVTGASVVDAVTALPQVTGATWTCVGAGGATCSGGTITGNIADTVNLPVGGTATYTLVVRLSASATGDLVNTATVTPPDGTTDPVPDPTPNTATDTDFAAAIFYVATDGLDSPTCGTSAAPCKTIQAAIDRTSAGDTVLVADGTYRECIVLVPGQGMGGVLVESSQFLNSGLTGAAILDGDATDGTDVCGSLASPGPVAKIFDKSALVGISIVNGDDSGVWGLGAVTISNNVIASNNTATTGGGIRLITGTYLTNPPARARITSNVIRDNTSESHGAGVYVEAKAQGGVPSAVTISGNNVSTNIAGGTLAASGAGIAVFADTASVADRSQVVITANTLNANQADGPTAGSAEVEGGGIFVATGEGNGLGTETVTIGTTGSGNVVRNNFSAGFGGGISVKARPAPGGTQTIAVTANTVSANSGDLGGGGVHLFARAFDRPAGAPVLAVSASGNALTGNFALGLLTNFLAAGGGGILAELQTARTAASGVQYEIFGNAIQSNLSTTHGGGASLVASADDDPDDDGTVQPTGALIAFHNNLVATNAARDTTASAPSGGGVHGLAVTCGASAVALLSASFLTVADNQTELYTGGVEWQDLLRRNCLVGPGTASFTMSNSIVSGNDGYGVGFTAPLQPSTTLGFSYVNAYANISGNYEPPLPDPTGTNGNISIDPELDALFLPRICGPMVDAGDPAIAATNEPLPNGGVVNLGHLGNTTSATRTFPDVNGDGTVDGLDVMGIAVSFDSVTGGARYFLAADRDLNGIVDGADLAYVSGFYAQSCP